MAKYYLGKNQDGIYVPIILENVGTGVLDVINYTMSFSTTDDLREELLNSKVGKLISDKIFKNIIYLSTNEGPGTIEEIECV